jgi:pantetheine-phosphate adenylyltransferase
MFERVIVGVAASAGKGPLFSLEERVEIATEVLKAFAGRVAVTAFTGLLADFARAQGAKVMLRGVRAVADFEYEVQMASINHKLAPDLETVFLTPTEQYTFLSASVVREVARFGGDVSPFVHPAVIARLQQKF